MQEKISFCIPVFNVGKYLAECLDSIIAQKDSNFEICIVDGGSNDGTTKKIIDTYQQKYPEQIKVLLRQERSGVDRDIFKALEMATGTYCWVFSGDDVLAEGAIQTVRQSLDDTVDLLMGAWSTCDINMTSRSSRSPNEMSAPEGMIALHDPIVRKDYFKTIVLPHNVWSFCSSIIVKRDWYLSKSTYQRFYGTCFALAGHLLEHSKERLNYKWISNILLHQRGDNDSFLRNGNLSLIAIYIDGYTQLLESTLGTETLEFQNIQRMLRNHVGLNWLMRGKYDAEIAPERKAQFTSLVQQLYCDTSKLSKLKKIYALTVPYAVHRIIYKGYSLLKPILKK